MEVGSLLPAASVPPMHVTTPVVEAPLVIEYVAPALGVTYMAPTPVEISRAFFVRLSLNSHQVLQ